MGTEEQNLPATDTASEMEVGSRSKEWRDTEQNEEELE